jgi:hypothetical protein
MTDISSAPKVKLPKLLMAMTPLQKRDSPSSLNGSPAFAGKAPDRAVSVLGKE